MGERFHPKFDDFHEDIERYLISAGKREIASDGMIVFHGYNDALELMFNIYLEQEAFDPLVSHFRSWNWEASYNDFLLRLTDALLAKDDWPRTQKLWGGVIAKRRRLYNEIRKIEKEQPGTLPSKTIRQARARLRETLERVSGFAEAIGTPEDVLKYSKMIEKIHAGGRL